MVSRRHMGTRKWPILLLPLSPLPHFKPATYARNRGYLREILKVDRRLLLALNAQLKLAKST